MTVRAVAVWFGLMFVAILNGALRLAVLIPGIGEAAGHVLSTLLLCAAIFLGTWLAIPWIDPRTPGRAWLVGVLWLVMTVGFEFGFGRLRRRSWRELLADYDIPHGRIWALVLITTLVAPWLAGRARGLWERLSD